MCTDIKNTEDNSNNIKLLINQATSPVNLFFECKTGKPLSMTNLVCMYTKELLFLIELFIHNVKYDSGFIEDRTVLVLLPKAENFKTRMVDLKNVVPPVLVLSSKNIDFSVDILVGDEDLPGASEISGLLLQFNLILDGLL